MAVLEGEDAVHVAGEFEVVGGDNGTASGGEPHAGAVAVRQVRTVAAKHDDPPSVHVFSLSAPCDSAIEGYVQRFGAMRWVVLGFCAVLGAFGAGGAARAAEAVSAELIRLHDDLKLSDGQEAAWHDYTTAIASDPQQLARHRATTELLPLVPTPRRVALIEATMAQDAVDFRRQGAAVNAFYGQLTPAQQKTFDQDTLPQGSDPRP